MSGFFGKDYPEVADPGPEGNEDAALTGHRGQVRIAYMLAERYANKLLHIHGLGWHRWDGKRWTADDRGAATRAVVDTLKWALSQSLGDQELRQDVRKCETAAGINGVLSIAAALEQFAATVGDLDADAYLLNVANGTLDLRTMELKAHDPADRNTKVCAAAYDPEAIGTAWETFLARVLPNEDVRAFVQRYAGLGLCGRVMEHVLAILTGTGRNGKGVFYGALGNALGDYAKVAEPDLFMHRENAHPTGEMDLLGVRWVVVSESEQGRKLAEATVKRLTGGDTIRARKMRQDFVQFEPSHTAALITNHLPKVRGDDPALWARLRVVPFAVVIPKEEQDPELGDKLALEIDAVLAWAIRGWQAYHAGGLAEPEAVVKATEDYHADSDAIARFIDAECLVNPYMSVTVADLWERWCRWRIDDGAEELSKKAWGQALDRRGFPDGRTNRARVRKGISLQATDEDAA